MGFSLLCILVSIFILRCILGSLRAFEKDVEEYEQGQQHEGESGILPPREQNQSPANLRADDDHFQQ